jgi:nucleoside-triphosphatase THEP1
MSIYIFTRAIHSGKTTELLNWSNQQKNISGILMPDIDGSRKIINLDTKEIFDAECVDAANTKEPLTSIGKFNFYSAAFEKANSVLLNALSRNPQWLVIDEAGKLEICGTGFYKSIAKAISIYNDKKTPGNLLITVRDNLCEEVIAFFNIKNYEVISSLQDIR